MRRTLGKGLSQLIAEQYDMAPSQAAVSDIEPNQRQPRHEFRDESLQELAASIREFGVLQPPIVRPKAEGKYELIAGERRLRAAKLAGLDTVPIVLRSAGNQSSLEIALIENIQREDINALECALAYRVLITEFDLTQEQVADKVGKSRAAVANTLRLLRLPAPILEGLRQGMITEGHARALLAHGDEARQLALYEQIVSRGLSVRDVERAAEKKLRRGRETPEPSHEDDSLQDALSVFLGARTKIARGPVGGKITVEFYSDEDLERILETLGFRV